MKHLRQWTENKLSDVIRKIELARRSGNRDFIIGVDVLVNDRGSGQFALWAGSDKHVLVAKRFPREKEDRFLAGVEATSPVHGQRVVSTPVGKALLLVCHDAQAFNHRNLKSVAKASRITPRAQAIKELHASRKTSRLTWALNLVHWVGSEENTQTFARSYSQLREDFPKVPVKVIGSFGYEPSLDVKFVPKLLRRLTSPELNLSKVVFY